MSPVRVILLLSLAFGAPALQGNAPAPREVSLTAADGTPLKATYYAAAKPGPAVLLLHMCNTTRASWAPLAPQLAEAGIHSLALDYRGFGESGGDRFDPSRPQETQKTVNEKWPGDIDAAYAYLLAQPGVDKTRVGAAGGSCGVNHAVQFARRHPEIKSLVLLAGTTSPEGLRFIEQTHWLPIFAAAAADDQYDANIPAVMEWMLALSGNPRNKFSGFKDGRHGTEIFGPHPELPKQIVSWYVDTLAKNPADPRAAVTAKKTPALEFWHKALAPESVSSAVDMFHAQRKRDPKVVLFPEVPLNLLGYQHLQEGKIDAAIELFKLNTEAYPDSANTYDSLGDGYLAAGKNDLALQASQKALAMLAADRAPDDVKKAVRASAEQRIAKLKGR
jgi:dienelactone hydrolase